MTWLRWLLGAAIFDRSVAPAIRDGGAATIVGIALFVVFVVFVLSPFGAMGVAASLQRQSPAFIQATQWSYVYGAFITALVVPYAIQLLSDHQAAPVGRSRRGARSAVSGRPLSFTEAFRLCAVGGWMGSLLIPALFLPTLAGLLASLALAIWVVVAQAVQVSSATGTTIGQAVRTVVIATVVAIVAFVPGICLLIPILSG